MSEELMQFAQYILQAAGLGAALDPETQQLVELALNTLNGDMQSALQLLAYMEQIKQAQAQQQPRSARRGAKLGYIKQLRGQCPDGTLLQYYKAGGHLCKKCVAMLAMQYGGEVPQDPIEAFKYGHKLAKALGGIKTHPVKRTAAQLAEIDRKSEEDYMRGYAYVQGPANQSYAGTQFHNGLGSDLLTGSPQLYWDAPATYYQTPQGELYGQIVRAPGDTLWVHNGRNPGMEFSGKNGTTTRDTKTGQSPRNLYKRLEAKSKKTTSRGKKSTK